MQSGLSVSMDDKPAKFRKWTAVNDRGRPIGESHHRARFTDADVDLIRTLHEEHGVPYSNLAAWFGTNKRTICRICRYEQRAQTVAGHKPVAIR